MKETSPSLQKFIDSHVCRPAPARPNTTLLFEVVDTTQLPIANNPSPLQAAAWGQLLDKYPGPLPQTLTGIIQFGALVGHAGPDRYIVSKNLKSARDAPDIITQKIRDDLALGRMMETTSRGERFISSPLGLVPKHNGKWRVIHHLSFPPRTSVNDAIDEDSAYLAYVKFEAILQMVLDAGKDCIMIKRDMRDAFRMIPIAPQNYWLFGLQWEGKYYNERVLPFGLRTAPFLFNLFAEAWEWILRSWTDCKFIEHFLDDTMAAFPIHLGHQLQQFKADYSLLCKLLGILCNDDKDDEGTLVQLLGRLVDSHTFTVSIPQDKVDRIVADTTVAIQRGQMTLLEAQKLAGRFAFSASAVQLGFVFCRRMWSFVASFKKEWRPSLRRRIPAPVMEDLLWWRDVYPVSNGIRMFDDAARDIIHLFADASVLGMGAFYLANVQSPSCDWKQHAASIQGSHAFAARLPAWDQEKPFDINVFEITALLEAFIRWSEGWRGKTVMLHTDSSTAQLGLLKQTLKLPDHNEPLRQLLLHAARLDIMIVPLHIAGEENELADALSRNKQDVIANWCPHWQISLHSLHPPPHGERPFPSLAEPNMSSSTR